MPSHGLTGWSYVAISSAVNQIFGCAFDHALVWLSLNDQLSLASTCSQLPITALMMLHCKCACLPAVPIAKWLLVKRSEPRSFLEVLKGLSTNRMFKGITRIIRSPSTLPQDAELVQALGSGAVAAPMHKAALALAPLSKPNPLQLAVQRSAQPAASASC